MENKTSVPVQKPQGACPGTRAMVGVYCNLVGRRVLVFSGGSAIDGTLRSVESNYIVLTRPNGDFYYFFMDRINWINVPAAQPTTPSR